MYHGYGSFHGHRNGVCTIDMGHFHGHRNGVYIYISHYMGNFHGHGVPQIQVIFMGIETVCVP